MDHPVPPDDNEVRRQRLRALRKALNFSQARVARGSLCVEGGFIDRTDVAKIEMGAKPLSYLNRSRLAAGLGVTLPELDAVLEAKMDPEILAAQVLGALAKRDSIPPAA